MLRKPSLMGLHIETDLVKIHICCLTKIGTFTIISGYVHWRFLQICLNKLGFLHFGL